MNEVYTDCPSCGEEIPFFTTVDGENAPDGEKRCPECHTDVDELFDIAINENPIEPVQDPEPELALTDGGRDE